MPVDEPSQRQARTFPVQTDATPPSPTTERGHTPADIWIIRRELRARPPTTTWLSIGERCRATGSSRRRLRSRHRSHYAPTDRQRSRRPCDRRAAPSSLADSNMSTGPARSSNRRSSNTTMMTVRMASSCAHVNGRNGKNLTIPASYLAAAKGAASMPPHTTRAQSGAFAHGQSQVLQQSCHRVTRQHTALARE